VLVTASALETGVGAGRVEGADMPVSIATVERIACSHGTVALAFDDDGQALNVGREQRLFTTRQRVALAARDGGCMFTDCDRPPAWCEAHHVEYWHRDVGKTDIADGILLCRYHHLLVHNNDWTITRDAEATGSRHPSVLTKSSQSGDSCDRSVLPCATSCAKRREPRPGGSGRVPRPTKGSVACHR